MAKVVTISRKSAVMIIEAVREAIADTSHDAESMRQTLIGTLSDARVVVENAEANELLSTLDQFPLEECTGEAHSSAHIDNCMACAPRWGWVGATVKVR